MGPSSLESYSCRQRCNVRLDALRNIVCFAVLLLRCAVLKARLGCALQAVIGAIYEDAGKGGAGLEAAQVFYLRHWPPPPVRVNPLMQAVQL